MKNSNVIQTLEEIKEMMERSSKVKAISGLSFIIIGVLACISAAYIYFGLGEYTLDTPEKLTITIIVALSLLTISLLTVFLMARSKAKRHNLRFAFDNTMRHLLVNFFVPLCTGGLLCAALIINNHGGLTSSVMLIFYGLSLISSQQFTYKALRYLGFAELILGLIDSFLGNSGLLMWFIGFGLFHILFGIFFIVKYEKGGKS